MATSTKVMPYEETPEVAAEEAKEGGSEKPAEPCYHYFHSNVAVEHPQEVHQGAIHFCVHPAVPVVYKIKYMLMSASLVTLQAFSITALLAAVDGMQPEDISEKYMDMHTLDWFMHILLMLLIGASALSELEQSRICDIQIFDAFASDDPAIARSARWGFPMLAVQKCRQLLLVPITLSTAPILAIESGLDALSMALNVMAILFIMEVDESCFAYFFSRPQREYLESVEIALTEATQTHLSWLAVGTFICTFTSVLFPIILYDPNALFAGGVPFSGWFSSEGGEPVKTLTLLASSVFSVMHMLELSFEAVKAKVWSAPRLHMLLYAWQLALSGLVIYVSISTGFAMSTIVALAVAAETAASDTAVAPARQLIASLA